MNTVSNSRPSKPLEITKDRIISDLKKIGMRKGDHVAVTLSLKSIGFVKGGPEAFIDALLETVGPDGTIMMNTFTLSFPPSKILSNYIFDPEITVSYTGLVPETLRKRKDAIRSQHPSCSVAAIGKLATYLTEDHDESSNPYMPYSKLAQIDGKYLCIGLGNRLVAVRHEAQRRAGLFKVPLFAAVKYRNGKGKIKIFFYKQPPCTENLPKMVPILDKMGILKKGKTGHASSILASAKELLNTMAGLLKKNPTLSLCDNIRCCKCRELERRMNLYERIANPRFFQKNALIRKIIALRNNFFLKRYNSPSFQKGEEKGITKNSLILSKILDIFIVTFSKIFEK